MTQIGESRFIEAKQGHDGLLLGREEHGLGVHLPVVWHINLECDNGFGDVNHFVHVVADAVGLLISLPLNI